MDASTKRARRRVSLGWLARSVPVLLAGLVCLGSGSAHAAPLDGNNTITNYTAGNSCSAFNYTGDTCDSSGIAVPTQGASGLFFSTGDLGSTYNGDTMYFDLVAGSETVGGGWWSDNPKVLDCSDGGLTTCSTVGTIGSITGVATWTMGSASHHYLVMLTGRLNGTALWTHVTLTYTAPGGGGSPTPTPGPGGGGSGGSGSITYPTIDMGAVGANVTAFFGFLAPILWLVGGISIGGLLLHKARGMF